MSLITGLKGALKFVRPILNAEGKALAVDKMRILGPRIICVTHKQQKVTGDQYNLYVRQKSQTLLNVALEEVKGCKRFFNSNIQYKKSKSYGVNAFENLESIPSCIKPYQLSRDIVSGEVVPEVSSKERVEECEVRDEETAKENENSNPVKKKHLPCRPKRRGKVTDLKGLLARVSEV
eukprot:TRINITY_DN0_c556_g1_i2.p1 TRINITY_DN0_c556_g1~~TRINITY_DN0_c556_g1_i2.p1  ORF type:complete len:178 (+),score=10.56 TRINITY_DN0_c556_g1_i2:107-640(+)